MEYKPEYKLKGNRVIVEVPKRTSDRNGIILSEPILSSYDELLVVKVGDAITDIKVGDSIIVDYNVFFRMQPFTLDKEEGLQLTLDINAAQAQQNARLIDPTKYKYRLIQYHDIVIHKSN